MPYLRLSYYVFNKHSWNSACSVWRTHDCVICSSYDQNCSKLLSLITLWNFLVASSGGKLIKNMVRNDLLEGNKVTCTLFAVNLVTEDVYVFACVSVSLSVAVITNHETEAGVWNFGVVSVWLWHVPWKQIRINPRERVQPAGFCPVEWWEWHSWFEWKTLRCYGVLCPLWCLRGGRRKSWKSIIF
jgi:hypothetical protein